MSSSSQNSLNSLLSNCVPLSKTLNLFAGDHCDQFGFCPFCEVVDCNHNHKYLKAGHAVGSGPMKSIPQTMKDHGETREVSFSICDLGMLENLWHLSHFLAKAMASTFKVSQIYPCCKALCASDSPPAWLPQTPS